MQARVPVVLRNNRSCRAPTTTRSRWAGIATVSCHWWSCCPARELLFPTLVDIPRAHQPHKPTARKRTDQASSIDSHPESFVDRCRAERARLPRMCRRASCNFQYERRFEGRKGMGSAPDSCRAVALVSGGCICVGYRGSWKWRCGQP
jgi:hypothetical protein